MQHDRQLKVIANNLEKKIKGELERMLRDDREGVTVEAAIPCEEQAVSWDEKTRNRYFRLVAECDYESMISHHYTNDCMLKRNIYMVDNSSVLVAVFDGKLGGTMHTVNYAKKQGLEIAKLFK